MQKNDSDAIINYGIFLIFTSTEDRLQVNNKRNKQIKT